MIIREPAWLDHEQSSFADDLRSSFANNVNDNANDKDNNNDYQRTCFADDLRSSFADDNNNDDDFIYLFGEKHQRGKTNNKNSPRSGFTDITNDISVNVNDDLQSWLNDDDIITEAAFPDNFRCIISGPSECGKAFLLKKLI